MTRTQIIAESPAWLGLVVTAARKLQAAQALLDSQVNMTSAAAAQTREGGRAWEKLCKRLEKISTE